MMLMFCAISSRFFAGRTSPHITITPNPKQIIAKQSLRVEDSIRDRADRKQYHTSHSYRSMPKEKRVNNGGGNSDIDVQSSPPSKSSKLRSSAAATAAADGSGDIIDVQNGGRAAKLSSPTQKKLHNDDDTDKKPAAKRRRRRTTAAAHDTPYDYANDTDSFAKIRSSKVCANRWSTILEARDNRSRITMMTNDTVNANVESIFDCSDLIIPPTTELIEQEVGKAIEKWKALDSRVIETDYDNDGSGVKDDAVSSNNSDPAGGDQKSTAGRPKKELLPPNFDYQCRFPPPDNNEDDEGINTSVGRRGKCQKRVISLMDPTKTLPYESELYKVFKSLPTMQEIERRYALGDCDDDNAAAASDSGNNDISGPSPSSNNFGCQHTIAVRNTLEKLRRRYTRIDAHSLGRMRVRDRHSSLYNYSARDAGSTVTSLLQTTLRFEVLKPQVEDLRRGSGPDGNRLEVELHGSQHTLLDLHRTLIEQSPAYKDTDDIPAGIFLIENVLYTHGDAGEAAADSIISQWLDKCNSQPKVEDDKEAVPSSAAADAAAADSNPSQRKPKVVPMAGIKLEDISIRLGVRYSHINLQSSKVCDNILSNASALYVTDIQSYPVLSSSSSGNEKEDQKGDTTRIPIVIHDIWTSSQQSQTTHDMCTACNYLPATVATMNDLLTDASLTFPSVDNSIESVNQGTPLCALCFRELHYQRDDESSGDLLVLRPNRSELKVFPVDRLR